MRFLINAITFEPGILQMSNYAYFVRADLLNRNLAKKFMWHVWIQFYSNFRSKISRALVFKWVCGNWNCSITAASISKLFLDSDSRMSRASFDIRHISLAFTVWPWLSSKNSLHKLPYPVASLMTITAKCKNHIICIYMYVSYNRIGIGCNRPGDR